MQPLCGAAPLHREVFRQETGQPRPRRPSGGGTPAPKVLTKEPLPVGDDDLSAQDVQHHRAWQTRVLHGLRQVPLRFQVQVLQKDMSSYDMSDVVIGSGTLHLLHVLMGGEIRHQDVAAALCVTTFARGNAAGQEGSVVAPSCRS